jgi:hypothetical protein
MATGGTGDVLTGLALHDLVIEDEDGGLLVRAERARARYSLRPLFDRRIAAEEIQLLRPEIRLVRGADERWNFQEIFAREAKPPGPPGWGSWIRIGAIEIEDGVVDVKFEDGGWPVLDWQANEFRDVNGTLEVALYSRDRNLKRVVAEDLSFHLTGPDIGPRSGRRVDPDSLTVWRSRRSARTPGTAEAEAI